MGLNSVPRMAYRGIMTALERRQAVSRDIDDRPSPWTNYKTRVQAEI